MMYYHDGKATEVNYLPDNAIVQKAAPYIRIYNLLNIISSEHLSLSEKKDHFKDVINDCRVGDLVGYLGRNYYVPSSVTTLRDYIDEDFVYAILVEFKDYPLNIIISILGSTRHKIGIFDDFIECTQTKECKRKINLFKLKYPNDEVLKHSCNILYKGKPIL